MSLVKYNQKRRFDNTPEPTGELKSTKSRRLEFVIQKHKASHLHYDLRLEIDGVMKSWAVPKGPSLDPKTKRLAMHVEDHPMAYNKFEGIIPKGNYGAGNVIIWDRGTYELDSSDKSWPATLREGYRKGDLKFILRGQKLHGSFALIKTPHMGENAWLLIKHKDKYATGEDITAQAQSVVSGQNVEDMSQEQKKLDMTGATKSRIITNVAPMLATLTQEPFDGDDWLFEIKWDGYRAIGSWDAKKAELYSRNQKKINQKYPSVTEALGSFAYPAIVDGEIVALDEEGRAHFEWLQNWAKSPRGQLVYYIFDILWCAGYDVRNWPLLRRKQLLSSVLPEHPSLRLSDHVESRGRQVFKLAEKLNLEGIMAKKTDSRYVSAKRSKSWLKIKTHLRQEVVIGGFTEPRGSRKHIGALILGIYEDGELRYVGHTGGGIPPDQIKSLRQQLGKLEIKHSPFVNKFKPNAPAHWVKPKLVCEVSFSEWTASGHMRQPIFKALREDKPPSKVHRERPTEKPAAAKAKDTKLRFTHLYKVFFPRHGYTKGDLIDYYRSVAQLMLPYIKDRPHSLLRQPNGIDGQSFFQKDVDHSPPDWVKTKAIYSDSNKKNINYLVPDSADSLLYMVQLGCIEINPWNSRTIKLDKPDWVVIDLDPEAIGFNKVVATAQMVRQVTEEVGIPSYPKTSGKTGIHIFIPLAAKYNYEQCKRFAQLLANLIHQRVPEFTSLVRQPSQRQKKVYIDFLQNRKGQTLAAPYSVRPTEDASISTPLKWSEVNKQLDPAKFNINTIAKRIDKVGDLWKPVLGKGIDMAKIIQRLEQ